ncbi:Actin-related protein 6 [Orobanche hederae]
MTAVVLDSGAGLIEAGIGGERDPLTVVPNCLSRPFSSKEFLIADQLLSPTEDLTSDTVRRPPRLPHKSRPSIHHLVNFTINYGVKRMDSGGKALTNYLKELISNRSINVMDESFMLRRNCALFHLMFRGICRLQG